MEASLLDMTRGLELYGLGCSPYAEIEVVRDDDDSEYDVVIEYVFDCAPIEDAFADPWFAVHEDALTAGEELPVAPIATRQSLHVVLGFAVAVAVATSLYAATL